MKVKTKHFYAEYAKEVLDELPIGNIDKTSTGIGITSLALENSLDTIVFVPNIVLTVNKASQYPNERCNYNIQEVWGKVKADDIQGYLADCSRVGQPIKIIATYDAIYKLEHLFPQCRMVIDESDRLLDLTIGPRRESIIKLMEVAKKHKEVLSLVTATPIPLKYLPDWIGKLPQHKFTWEGSIVAKPILAKRTYPFKALKEEFIKPLRDGGEMTVVGRTYKKVIVFINSVTTIGKIIKDLKLPKKDCAVISGDTIRNQNILKGIKRYRPGDYFKYLFITSSGFQGIDIYDKDAMTIAVSNTQKTYTMMDLRTDLRQAISRNRNKDNPNYGTYIFIYNQSIFKDSEKELINKIDTIKDKIYGMLDYVNLMIKNSRPYGVDSDFGEYTVKTKDGYYRLFEESFEAHRYFILETRKQFTKGFNIAGTIGQIQVLEPIELPKNVTYPDLVKYFRKNHKGTKIDWGVYSTRTDWITVIESLWRLKKITVMNYTQAKDIIDAQGDSYKELIVELRQLFKKGERYSIKEINRKLQKVYDREKLGRKAKASDLYEIFGTNKVEASRTSTERGFKILKQ